MTSDNWLAIFMVATVVFAVWLHLTGPRTTSGFRGAIDMSDKVIRDGKVAVIVSPGFGAGWSTWADDEHAAWCRHDPALVEAVEAKDWDRVKALAEACDEDIYLGGNEVLVVEWVPKGAPYYIHEYDGNEWIVTDFLRA